MGYAFAMEYSLNHLNQSLVEPFYNTIGFQTIWCNELLLNAFHFAMILENFINKLTIVVTMDGLDLSFWANLHHGLELFEDYQDF